MIFVAYQELVALGKQFYLAFLKANYDKENLVSWCWRTWNCFDDLKRLDSAAFEIFETRRAEVEKFSNNLIFTDIQIGFRHLHSMCLVNGTAHANHRRGGWWLAAIHRFHLFTWNTLPNELVSLDCSIGTDDSFGSAVIPWMMWQHNITLFQNLDGCWMLRQQSLLCSDGAMHSWYLCVSVLIVGSSFPTRCG